MEKRKCTRQGFGGDENFHGVPQMDGLGLYGEHGCSQAI